MSSEQNAPQAAISHGHEAFDPEPIRMLPADEPRTPLWMPVLGVALFAVAGLVLATRGDETAEGGKAAASASASVAADAPPALPEDAQRRLPPPGRGAPPPEVKKIRQQLLDARRAGAAPGRRPDGVRPLPPTGNVPPRPTPPRPAPPQPAPPRPAPPRPTPPGATP